MRWTKKQISQHYQAAERLALVNEETLRFLRQQPKVSEYQAAQFILRRYKQHKLKTSGHSPIVAFRQNTSHVHYFPSQYCLSLKQNSLILLDIWARLDEPRAPFADMTWMAYYGQRVPEAIAKIFQLVCRSRDLATNFLRAELQRSTMPTGAQVDQVARQVIGAAGYAKNFLHSTGHALGTTSPHGSSGRISWKNQSPLQRPMGYTIEPAVYLPGKFGVRSEIDCFIPNRGALATTTPVQKMITKV